MRIRSGWLLAIAGAWLALAIALMDAFSVPTAVLLPAVVFFALRNPPRALGLIVFLAPGLGMLCLGTSLYVAAPIFESVLFCLTLWLARLA